MYFSIQTRLITVPLLVAVASALGRPRLSSGRHLHFICGAASFITHGEAQRCLFFKRKDNTRPSSGRLRPHPFILITTCCWRPAGIRPTPPHNIMFSWLLLNYRRKDLGWGGHCPIKKKNNANSRRKLVLNEGLQEGIKFLKNCLRGVRLLGEFGSVPGLEPYMGIGWNTQFAGNVLHKLPHIQTNWDIYFKQACAD